MNPFQTFKDKPLNQISQKLIDYIAKRPLKGKAEYQMLNSTMLFDPTLKTPEERMVYPSLTMVHLKTTIKDPETGRTVTIGNVKRQEDDGSFTFENIKVMAADRGKIVLHEERPSDDAIYNLLELHEQNESNPYRDKTQQPLFKRIDRLKDAQDQKALNDMLFKALQAIDMMSMEEKRLIHSAEGGSYTDEAIIIDTSLAEKAKKDPEYFYKLVDSPLVKVKALVKQAQDFDVIQFDQQQHRFIWAKNKEAIATLDRVEGANILDQMADYLNTHKEGLKIQKQIETVLKTK